MLSEARSWEQGARSGPRDSAALFATANRSVGGSVIGSRMCRRAAFAEATACQARLPLQASSRVRGSASRGVRVIDDFGYHPIAITQTLTGLRHRYSGHRIWAVSEPRSNTTRRAVFQQELPVALGLADGVFLSEGGKARADSSGRTASSRSCH